MNIFFSIFYEIGRVSIVLPSYMWETEAQWD